MIQKSILDHTTNNNSSSYLLFAFGAVVIIIGVYLSTYSTVVMVDQSFSIPYMISYSVPLPTQIYPYESIGAISILSALTIIGIAVYQAVSN